MIYPVHSKNAGLKATTEWRDDETVVLHQMAQFPIDQVYGTYIQGAHAPPYSTKIIYIWVTVVFLAWEASLLALTEIPEIATLSSLDAVLVPWALPKLLPLLLLGMGCMSVC